MTDMMVEGDSQGRESLNPCGSADFGEVAADGFAVAVVGDPRSAPSPGADVLACGGDAVLDPGDAGRSDVVSAGVWLHRNPSGGAERGLSDRRPAPGAVLPLDPLHPAKTRPRGGRAGGGAPCGVAVWGAGGGWT